MFVNKEVWVLVEQREGELQEVSLELVCGGRKIADKLNQRLCAVVFADEVAELVDSLTCYGADKVYIINDSSLKDYTAEAYAEVLSTLISEGAPEILLCAATLFGKDIASMLAARLKTGLASDCIDLNVSDDGLLSAVSPVYGDKAYATVVCPLKRPQIATVRPGVMEIKPAKVRSEAEVITVEPQPLATTHSRVIGFMKADPSMLRLDEADIIISGGGGAGGSEGFHLLEDLAKLLGGCVGASRVAVDRGWVPVEKQVGQTGTVVAPRLYIAVGISGSTYHNMGMKDSRVIVAVNKDRNAPIFKLADIGIIGDSKEIVSVVISYLGEMSESTKKTFVP